MGKIPDKIGHKIVNVWPMQFKLHLCDPWDLYIHSVVTKLRKSVWKRKILKRENRIELYKDSLKFLKIRVNLDLALFKDDIWSH